jgi:hypothetical protein
VILLTSRHHLVVAILVIRPEESKKQEQMGELAWAAFLHRIFRIPLPNPLPPAPRHGKPPNPSILPSSTVEIAGKSGEKPAIRGLKIGIPTGCGHYPRRTCILTGPKGGRAGTLVLFAKFLLPYWVRNIEEIRGAARVKGFEQQFSQWEQKVILEQFFLLTF